jgi:predicted dehydrogenase
MSPHTKPVRIGVLGTGAIAQVSHLPILSRMKGVELAGVADTDRAKAKTIAQRFGVPRIATSAEEMLAWDDLDAVVVCTPSHLHQEHVIAALEAGKYVLCEKPLALTSAGAEQILATPGASDRLVVGMNQRFRADALTLKPFIAGGELGEIFYLRTGWLNRRVGRGRLSWRQRRARAGGGVLMDLGFQMLDLALWLLDYPEPKRVVAHLHRTPGMEVEDSAVLLLYLEGHRVINLEVTWNLQSPRERQFLSLLGSMGSAALSPLDVTKELDGELHDVTPQLSASRENPFTASYRQEMANFAEIVRGEKAATAPVEQVTLLKVLEAAYRSDEEGRDVAI